MVLLRVTTGGYRNWTCTRQKWIAILLHGQLRDAFENNGSPVPVTPLELKAAVTLQMYARLVSSRPGPPDTRAPPHDHSTGARRLPLENSSSSLLCNETTLKVVHLDASMPVCLVRPLTVLCPIDFPWRF